MPDMLVNLLNLNYDDSIFKTLEEQNIVIRRPRVPNKAQIVDWVREHSGIKGSCECEICFSHVPVSCFIATRGSEILGYACYNSIAPGFFGPTRVSAAEQGKGIGKALLLRTLRAMHDEGYVYAIIGGVGPQEFYKKTVHALLIPDSDPGIYKDVLERL